MDQRILRISESSAQDVGGIDSPAFAVDIKDVDLKPNEVHDDNTVENGTLENNGNVENNEKVEQKETVEQKQELAETGEAEQKQELAEIGEAEEEKQGLAETGEAEEDGYTERPFEPDNTTEDYTFDIWALPDFKPDFTPWSELTRNEKIKRVAWHYVGKILLFLFCLYIFVCSLSFLGDAFQLLGGKTAGNFFTRNEILSNPIAGLMIGILATVLLQSSSTTTSIVISMVAADILTVKIAIPIVMGANIGTTVTNTIVSLGQITCREDFRRAFAGATVHDLFNFLTVCVLLPIEVITGYLEKLSHAIVKSTNLETNEAANQDYLKVITKPLTSLIIQIDKKVLQSIAKGDSAMDYPSIIKHNCGGKRCKFMFERVSSPDGKQWSDTAIGVILLLIALTLLCVCLVGIIKILHSLLKGQMALWIRGFINANFPGKLAYFTGYLAILLGAGCTILLQSSSIFTSSLTPLVGMGVLTIERMYPLTLGANIGTTATGILAAFALEGSKLKNTLQIALCHLFFNITGIIIFYPLPFFRPPINGAKFLGIRAAKYRWFAAVYLAVPFFIIPFLGFALSVAHWAALAVIFIPILLLILAVLVIKVIQKRWPEKLPEKFRTWKWLPVWLRSLEPWDKVFIKLMCNFRFCRRFHICKQLYEDENYTEENRDIGMGEVDV